MSDRRPIARPHALPAGANAGPRRQPGTLKKPKVRRLAPPGRRPAAASDDGAAEQKRLRRISEVMTVEGVANFLHCSAQAVRGVPEADLPRRRGPGRRLLFLKEDVIAYLRRSQRPRANADELVRDIESEVLDSSPDSGRRRSPRRTG